MKTVVGFYDTAQEAYRAVEALRAEGFLDSQISLILRDATGEYEQYLESSAYTSPAGEGLAAGAGVGALLGGLGGLLAGLGALAIPGIGAVVAAGPLLSTLTGAATGAVVGSLIGALVDLGVPEAEAELYAEGLRRGGALVVVQTDDAHAGEALDVMHRYDMVDINTRAGEWRRV